MRNCGIQQTNWLHIYLLKRTDNLPFTHAAGARNKLGARATRHLIWQAAPRGAAGRLRIVNCPPFRPLVCRVLGRRVLPLADRNVSEASEALHNISVPAATSMIIYSQAVWRSRSRRHSCL